MSDKKTEKSDAEFVEECREMCNLIEPDDLPPEELVRAYDSIEFEYEEAKKLFEDAEKALAKRSIFEHDWVQGTARTNWNVRQERKLAALLPEALARLMRQHQEQADLRKELDWCYRKLNSSGLTETVEDTAHMVWIKALLEK